VVLKRADGPFSRVATVDMWGRQLIVDGLVSEELLECQGRLIVKTLEAWCEAMAGEQGDAALVGCQDVSARVRRAQGFGMDVIAVVIVDNQHVTVAPTGGDKESPCHHVCGNLTCHEVAVRKDGVGAEWGWDRGVSGCVMDQMVL